MAKKFKLLISNTVLVAIVVAMKDDEGKTVEKKATLVCDRTTASEIRADTAQPDKQMAEVLTRVVKDWREQNLVADEDTGQPAPFSPDALAAMLEIPGMATVAWLAYMREVAAKEKN